MSGERKRLRNPTWQPPIDPQPTSVRRHSRENRFGNTSPGEYDVRDPFQTQLWRSRPKTRLQALMEAAPGDEPEVSVEDYTELRELLADAIESLDPFERILFEAYFIEKLSFRAIEKRFANTGTGRPMKKFSKTTLHRMAHDIRQKLAGALADNPIVASHLLALKEDEDD